MFTKKRKQKEKNLSSAKISKKKLDNEYMNPQTPMTRPDSPTFSVCSEDSRMSSYSPPPSRPSTPRGDPILSSKDSLIFFGDQDIRKGVSLPKDYRDRDSEGYFKKDYRPQTPMTRPDSPTFSVCSEDSRMSSYSPPPSRPSTPRGDPILSSKDSLIFFGDQDIGNEVALPKDYINNTTQNILLNQLDMIEDDLEPPLTPSIRSSSPTFSVYSESSEVCHSPEIYKNPSTPSIFLNSPIPSASNEETSLSFQLDKLVSELIEPDKLNYPVPQSPIDFDNLEKYANLASPTTVNWSDTESFIRDNPLNPPLSDDSVFKVPYPVVDKVSYKSVFTCIQDGSELTYFFPVNEETIVLTDNNLSDVSSDIEESMSNEDEEYNLTSDQLFEIMCHISDCNKEHKLLDEDLVGDIAGCEGFIRTFNFIMQNVINKTIAEDSNPKAAYKGTLTRAIISIFNNIKKSYRPIYPARQIWELMKTTPSDICCPEMLSHEDDIDGLVSSIKAYIYALIKRPPKISYEKFKREENVKIRISCLIKEYAKLYNLE